MVVGAKIEGVNLKLGAGFCQSDEGRHRAGDGGVVKLDLHGNLQSCFLAYQEFSAALT